MSNARVLAEISAIYSAARASDDGQRCMVAPSPELHRKIKEAVKSLAAASSLPSTLRVAASETKILGFNDGVVVPPNQFPLGTAPSAIRAAASRVAGPLRGIVRVVVVLVEFPDKAMSATAQHFEDLFFSEGKVATKSVREYYADVTNGLIDIQGEVIGPYVLPQTLQTYANGASGTGLATPNAQTMARDAALAADPHIDFTPYDNDGNGYVDAFIVVHAGAGGEVTGKSGDLWSHKWTLDGGPLAVDQTKIFAYLTVPEDCKLGVCAHELGHLLFGFPDLYDTDYTSEGVGNWCLMGGGSWGGNGDTPTHPSAWCKVNQAWVSVDTRTTNAALKLDDVKTSHSVCRLWKDGTMGNEYFLLENRQQTGFDVSLPGAGLLIWHIDESQQSNTDEHHYKVALMQADNKRELELGQNRGDAGDPYPGSATNRTFDSSSSPSSKSYAGVESCVAVTGITATGATIAAKVQVKCVAARVARAAPARPTRGRPKRSVA